MKTYLIVNATPNPDNQQHIEAYTGGVLPLLQNAGGKDLRRAKLANVVKGEAKYPLFLFMEFEDGTKVDALFQSEEYKELIPHREKAFAELNIYTFTDL
ncbi:MAG: DUF1330 domain-containing protein [Ekhidna sp.]|nr:DUF1330 domain-containing protein [Ekhidna sp.]